jgi:hypothetical protein
MISDSSASSDWLRSHEPPLRRSVARSRPRAPVLCGALSVSVKAESTDTEGRFARSSGCSTGGAGRAAGFAAAAPTVRHLTHPDAAQLTPLSEGHWCATLIAELLDNATPG